MKKIILLFLLFGLATAVFAQNYSEAEQQINQAIRENTTEFERLRGLLNNTFNERQLNSLVNAFNSRQNQIRATQREIERLIKLPAARQVIDHQFEQLQNLMKAQERQLERLNSLRN